jgi:hypothetical protein
MREEEYPALYQAANAASIVAQSTYLRCIKAFAGFSILGALFATVGVESKEMAVLAALAFLAGLAVSILMAVKRYDATWYRARAVAESVKTTSWRFVTRAEPFDSASPTDFRRKFTEVLGKILKEHKDLAKELGGDLSQKSQLSERMTEMREMTLVDRISIYSKERIQSQRAWYAQRSATFRRHGRGWFWVLVSLQAGAIALVCMRIAWPEWKFWPIHVLVVAASGVLVWIQSKRYGEVSAAYGLTAHEIGLAGAELRQDMSEAEFSQFVSDTESAFSREHTQWVARKG